MERVYIYKVKNRQPDEEYYRDENGKPIFVNFNDRIEIVRKIVEKHHPPSDNVLIIPDFVNVDIIELDEYIIRGNNNE